MTKTTISEFSDTDSVEYDLDQDIRSTLARLRAVRCEEATLRQTLDALLAKRKREATGKVQKAQLCLQFVNEDDASIRRILEQESASRQESTSNESGDDGNTPNRVDMGDAATRPTVVGPTPNQALDAISERDVEYMPEGTLGRWSGSEPARTDSALEAIPAVNGFESEHTRPETHHPHTEDETERKRHSEPASRNTKDQRRQYDRVSQRLHVAIREFELSSEEEDSARRAREMDEDAVEHEWVWEAALAAAIEQRRAEESEEALAEQLEIERIRRERVDDEALFREIQRAADEEAAFLAEEQLEDEIHARLLEEEDERLAVEEQEHLEAEVEEYYKRQQEEEERIIRMLQEQAEELAEAERYYLEQQEIQLVEEEDGYNRWQEEKQIRLELEANEEQYRIQEDAYDEYPDNRYHEELEIWLENEAEQELRRHQEEAEECIQREQQWFDHEELVRTCRQQLRTAKAENPRHLRQQRQPIHALRLLPDRGGSNNAGTSNGLSFARNNEIYYDLPRGTWE